MKRLVAILLSLALFGWLLSDGRWRELSGCVHPHAALRCPHSPPCVATYSWMALPRKDLVRGDKARSMPR